jgi:hypothetical protein
MNTHHTRATAPVVPGPAPKDAVAMPLTRSAKTFVPRPLRPTTPHCRGGASSVLRLTQPAAPRLPSGLDLSDWMSRAAVELMPVTGPLAGFASRTRATGV